MMKRILGACAALLFGLGAARAYDGQIIDATTHQGVADGVVVLGGQRIVADASGHFHLDASAGHGFARAPGYRAGEFDLAATGAPIALTPFVPKALYLSIYGAGSKSIRDAALEAISDGGANALVINVKSDDGAVPYPSKIALVMSDGARKVTTIPDLAGLVSELHAKHIYLIARIVSFKDNTLTQARPDLAIKRADGSLYRDREKLTWLDPLQADARNYNIAIAVEAAQAGFDEIQFDYVRFPDFSGRLKFSGPVDEPARLAAIHQYLSDARKALLPYNVYVSADIFGYVCWNKNDTGIGQRLELVAPDVDYMAPMLYPSGFQFGIPGYVDPVAHPYEIIHASLENAQARLKISPLRFRPWLQAFKDYAFDHRKFTADAVSTQIKAAGDFGADGWMLWNPRNDYSETGLILPKPAPQKVAQK